ncbi:MAG: serine/threonine-protein kinase [Vicinamibacterales bacterium]
MSPGQLVGPYKLQGQLGAGGMGVVWVAEDTRLGRQVALKFLPTSSLGSDSALERFRLEARAASALSHPGICAIHDIGVHEDAPYIVMELLKGETLRDRIVRGPLRIADVLDIGIQLADALATAHAQGIVHRDIKPANVVVDDKQRPKLLDFGLAKLATGRYMSSTPDDVTLPGVAGSHGSPSPLTVAGTALGTVAYMSPEQARGEDVDARTDIFSLGVVLYEMVTGQQAFTGATTAVVFDAILNRAPISPAVLKPDTPPRLVDAIHTALEKDRALRFQHAEELEAELKRIRRDLQSGATGATTRATTAAAAIPAAITPPPIPAAASVTPPPIPIPAAVMPPAPPPSSGAPAYVPVPDARPAKRRRRVGLAWAVIGLMFGISSFCNSPARQMFSSRTATRTTPDVSRAEQRLAAKDYRAALVEAEAVLKEDDEDDDALRVKREAEKQIAALEALAARVRTAAQSGDVTEAARLLAEAQELAPGDAVLSELSVLVRSATDAPPAVTTKSGVQSKVAAAGAGPAAPAAMPSRVDPPVPAASAAATAPPPPAVPAPPAPGGPPPPSVPRGDEPEVRRVLDVYRRAVAARDFNLFRTIFPALTPEDEQRLRVTLGPGGPQPLAMRVEQLTIDGTDAEARVVFIDPAPVRPRLSQILGLAKRDGAWQIVRLGPPLRRPRLPR